MSAEAKGSAEDLKYWPAAQGAVYQWHFRPFEIDGKPTTAEVEEYANLIPPERLPKSHFTPPAIRPDSKIAITLERSGCMGSCPSYQVRLSTEAVEFKGGGFVVASGKHTAALDPSIVRALARQFVMADFYSMDPSYLANVTDMPGYSLTISIDGEEKQVHDYVGSWVGMPDAVSDLENKVDEVAQTSRWVEGKDGLVLALKAEKYDFHTFDAQATLKAAAQNGQIATVRELLDAGVPLKPIPAPKPKEPYMRVPFADVGWLNAASAHPDALQILLDAGASNDDQEDKDLALAGAANTGSLLSVRALLNYGADPNYDLSKRQGAGRGSALISAASSGKPDVLREILMHKPKLELRGQDGQTAMFAAGDYRNTDADGARIECVRLLAEAGANVNARDDDGNTPLHETFLEDVAEELIKLGANVNARNDDGETPLFTTVSDEIVKILIAHGADPYIQNKKGKTVFDEANTHGPSRERVLREAIAEAKERQR